MTSNRTVSGFKFPSGMTREELLSESTEIKDFISKVKEIEGSDRAKMHAIQCLKSLLDSFSREFIRRGKGRFNRGQ